MCIDKRAPRVWFEDVGDAMQAGAVAIKIDSQADQDALAVFAATEPPIDPVDLESG